MSARAILQSFIDRSTDRIEKCATLNPSVRPFIYLSVLPSIPPHAFARCQSTIANAYVVVSHAHIASR